MPKQHISFPLIITDLMVSAAKEIEGKLSYINPDSQKGGGNSARAASYHQTALSNKVKKLVS